MLNSRNEHLGYSILQAWSMLASLGCDILGGANNDFLFEPGWEENLISCFQETDVDYILSCFHKHRSKKLKKCTTKSGKGVYIEDRNPMGAGYFIRSKHFTDRGLKHSTKPFSYKNIGPGPHWQREVKRRKLKGIRLLSPAVLVRKPEYSNPEYVKYYDEVFGIRGMENTLKTYRKMERDGTPRGTLNWNEFIDKYYSDKINEKEK